MLDLKHGNASPPRAQPPPLAKIRQGPYEPYSDFINRLKDAAEQIIGKDETESTFIKHLAFETANPACKDAIGPHRSGAEISDFIKLCAGIGSAHSMGLAIGA